MRKSNLVLPPARSRLATTFPSTLTITTLVPRGARPTMRPNETSCAAGAISSGGGRAGMAARYSSAERYERLVEPSCTRAHSRRASSFDSCGHRFRKRALRRLVQSLGRLRGSAGWRLRWRGSLGLRPGVGHGVASRARRSGSRHSFRRWSYAPKSVANSQ
jgi:hypothetical protein